jgi:threonine dehydratase
MTRGVHKAGTCVVHPTYADVLNAAKRIGGRVDETPIIRVRSSFSADAWLKLESLQRTGSFKIRGATNAILSLDRPPGSDVVCASTGNHGRAVAAAATASGLHPVVFVSSRVPAHRRAAIEALGADIRVVGSTQDEAVAGAVAHARACGAPFIHPFDDPAVIAGQGTIGLEIKRQQPDVDAILVPVSGGGLLSGVALALTETDRPVRVVGVSSDRAVAMAESVKAHKPVLAPERTSIADNLGGGIGLGNQHTLPLVERLVDEIVFVSDEEIREAMRWLLLDCHLLAEGAGAASVAALLSGRGVARSLSVVAVVSGGNIDAPSLRGAVLGRTASKRS